jgi:N-acetylneuraminic acid mutarotase
MKRTQALNVPLFLTISLLLIALLFTVSWTGSAQSPDPTPVTDAVGEPQPLGTPEPPPIPFTQEAGVDFGQALTLNACTDPPTNWEIQEPLPTPAFGAAVATDGQYVYAAGGNSTTIVDLLRRYNPAANQWTTLTPLPTAVRNALAVYANGKLYVIGGEGQSGVVDIVQIYNTSTGLWSSGAPMPGVRHQMGGGYYNGRIYAVGGYNSAGVSPQNQTWEYTIATNSWSAKANLPTALGGPGSGVVDGYLYILGGRDAAQPALNTAYKYNIAGNSWSAVANLLEAVNYPGSAVHHDRIWLFGGGVPFRAEAALAPEGVESVNTTQVYDPASNTWSYGPAQNVARSFQGGAAVHNRIISVGGWAGTDESATVEVLTQEPLKTLIIYADAGTVPKGLQFALLGQGGVAQVDVFNGETGTPSLAQLQNYHIVIPFSNSAFYNSAALGDVLADYQDSGGTVVAFAFDWYGGFAIGGRWVSGGYSPFNPTGTTRFQTAVLGSYTTNHPLMDGITSLSAYFRLQLTVAAGAVQVAAWDDGQPLIVSKGRAVGVNAYVGDHAGGWSGDFARVIVNAGNWLWLSNRSCDLLVCARPSVIYGSISNADPAQLGRISRADPPSTCALPQQCFVNDTAYLRHYDAYVFVNNDIQPQCVTVTVDPGTCIDGSHWIQSAAYLGTYNPASQCANFLGDIGGSPLQVKSYSFTVPPWQTYSVVVNEVDPSAYCPGYKLTVSADDCAIKEAYLPAILRHYP